MSVNITGYTWPYYQPTTQGYITLNSGSWSGLSQSDFERIEAMIERKLQEALHPETKAPSVTATALFDGKHYKGTLYQVEEDENKDDAYDTYNEDED